MPLLFSGTGDIGVTAGVTTLSLNANGRVASKSGFSVVDDSNQSVLAVAANNQDWGIWFDTQAPSINGVVSKTAAYFGGDANVLSFIGSGIARWSVNLNTGAEFNWHQRTGYDRLWDNFPSITVFNDTVNGPCSEYRIHGAPGISGGDFSVVTRSDGGFVSGSDARRKTNIETISGALEKVCQLRGVTFNIINREGKIDPYLPGKKMGYLAQEAINIIPESVSFDPNADIVNENGWASAYAIDYSSVVPLLSEAIKELKDQLDSALQKIALLEGK